MWRNATLREKKGIGRFEPVDRERRKNSTGGRGQPSVVIAKGRLVC